MNIKEKVLECPMTNQEVDDVVKSLDISYPCIITYSYPDSTYVNHKNKVFCLFNWHGSWGFESIANLNGNNALSFLVTPVYIKDMQKIKLTISEFTEEDYVIYVKKQGGICGNNKATEDNIRAYFKEMKNI